MSRIRIVFLVLILVFPGAVRVQTIYAEGLQEPDVWLQPRQSRYDTMVSVKEEITRLIVENRQMEERYAILLEQWEALQQQTDRLPGDTVQRPAKQPTQRKPVQQLSIDPKNSTPLGQEIRSVKGELVAPTETLKLLELYLADLRYQRRELELELKLHEFENQERRQTQLREQARLKNELQSGLLKERQMLQAIQRKQNEVKQAPQEIPRLERENQALNREIPTLQKKVEFKKREIGILQDKMVLQRKASAPVLSHTKTEQQKLQKNVAQLRERYESLSTTVSTSLRRQERKEQLIRDIIVLDKENQKLQQDIEELNDKIHYHTY